jgi:hypothetical protein
LENVKASSDRVSVSGKLLIPLPPDQLLVQDLDLDLLGRLERRHERVDQGRALVSQFVVLKKQK